MRVSKKYEVYRLYLFTIFIDMHPKKNMLHGNSDGNKGKW